ncbi:hypothetical protein BSNK01_18330 [Bacillaceae bacterium]
MSETFVPYPLKFRPIPQERLWGGRKLAAFFHQDWAGPIGEVWTLSDHPSAPSVCVNGPLEGSALQEIIRKYPEAYLGKQGNGGAQAGPASLARFPLLIKFIHAESDLSVQIHPDDAYALAHENDYGKTEAWYVLDAKPGARIVYGHTFGDRDEYFRAVEEKRVKEYLRYRDVKKGDTVFVPARTLHALLGGIMVIEVQQSSDVTYRVYDWDRVDKNGKPRELHIEKAADVLRYGEEANGEGERGAAVLREEPGIRCERLVRCPYFTLEKLELEKAAEWRMGNPGNPDVVIVAEGEGELAWGEGTENGAGGGGSIGLAPGDTLLVPATCESYRLQPKAPLKVLRCYYPSVS